MELKKFDVSTIKLNVIHFPDCIDDRFVLLNLNSNLNILSPKNNEQKVLLTYHINSDDLPLHIMWECRIKLTFDENLNEKINEEYFSQLSNVVDVINKQIENVSNLVNIELPSFSDIIND